MRSIVGLYFISILIFLGAVEASAADWVDADVPGVKIQFEVLLIDSSKPRQDPEAQVSVREFCNTQSCGLLHPVIIEHTLPADTKVSDLRDNIVSGVQFLWSP